MLYMVCPTCGFCLGQCQIKYQQEWHKISHNHELNLDDKQKARKKLLERLGVKRYCCRMRLMSSMNEEEILVPRQT